MFWARYFNENSENWERVRADHYDKSVHGTNLFCGEDTGTCDARVFFRKGGRKNASNETTLDHFATYKGQIHHMDCPHNPDNDLNSPKYSRQNLQEALNNGKYILLNLNGDFGLPVTTIFNNAAQKSRYEQFKDYHKGNYITASIKSATDMVKMISKLEKAVGIEQMFKQTAVGYRTEWRSLWQTLVGNDPAKLYKSYEVLAKDLAVMQKSDRERFGFPRLFFFDPTERSGTQYDNADHMNGTRRFLGRNGRTAAILLQSPAFQNNLADYKNMLIANKRSFILAVPGVNMPEIEQARADYRGQKKSVVYVHQSMIIESPDQIAAMPETETVSSLAYTRPNPKIV